MRNIHLICVALTGFAILLSSCHRHKPIAGIEATAGSLTQLKEWMSGSFSSREQSLTDTNFYDIRLRMVPIWPERKPGFFLYVEQAMASAMDKPYRQRIYHVTSESDGTFVSEIFTIANPLRFAGKLADDSLFRNLTPDSLVRREGCEVVLQWSTLCNCYQGGTGRQTCPSERAGAAWATSEVTVTARQMVSWDRGWDADGRQVWGATKGGYVFKKE